MKKLFMLMPILLMAVPAFGAPFDLVLQWDENTEPDLATGENARYKIYKGLSTFNGIKPTVITPESGIEVIEVKVADDENPDSVLVQKGIAGLDDEISYYFTVTALDNSGNESKLSNEVHTVAVDRTAPAAPKGLIWWKKLIQGAKNYYHKLFGGLRIA